MFLLKKGCNRLSVDPSNEYHLFGEILLEKWWKKASLIFRKRDQQKQCHNNTFSSYLRSTSAKNLNWEFTRLIDCIPLCQFVFKQTLFFLCRAHAGREAFSSTKLSEIEKNLKRSLKGLENVQKKR